MSSQEELEIKEIIAGANLKSSPKIVYENRYGEEKTDYNPSNLYEISEGEVSFNLTSINAQLGYYPEYKKDKSPNYQKLTFTPPINDLKFIGEFDFFYGDKLKDFPFGLLAGSINSNYQIAGYNGSFDAVAIGINSTEEFVYNKELMGKNYNTFYPGAYPPVGYADGYYVALLGEDLKHIKTLKYPAFDYSKIKMDFYNDKLFLIGIKELIRATFPTTQNNVISVYIDGYIVFKDKLKDKEHNFKFFRTHKYMLAYSKYRFIFINKTNNVVINYEIQEEIKHIVFNPILKTISVFYDDKDISVYKIYHRDIKQIKAKQPINPQNEKYAKQWQGNLDYDYSLKEYDSDGTFEEEEKQRGHYLKEIGEYEADYEVGHLTKTINLNLYGKDDFYLNNTDDGDVGTKFYLKNRRFKTKLDPKISIVYPAYVRMYKNTRQIVFFSSNLDNDRGRLFLFKY